MWAVQTPRGHRSRKEAGAGAEGQMGVTPAGNRAPCWGEDGGAGYQMCAHTHTHRSVRSDKGRQGRSLTEVAGYREPFPGGNPQNWALREQQGAGNTGLQPEGWDEDVAPPNTPGRAEQGAWKQPHRGSPQTPAWAQQRSWPRSDHGPRQRGSQPRPPQRLWLLQRLSHGRKKQSSSQTRKTQPHQVDSYFISWLLHLQATHAAD